MFPSLRIIDNFLPADQCAEARRAVLENGFKTVNIHEGGGNFADYHTVNVDVIIDGWADRIGEAIGKDIDLHIAAFRLGAENSPLHNYVHADHICSKWAAVYFLNLPEQCMGGTAFWRHKKFGWDAMPTSSQLEEEAGYTIEELSNDWHDPNAWILTSLAGMKNNRIIIYPSQMFHSRFPFEGFGNPEQPETCRLVHCSFYDEI